jgi:hypothetical protein
MRRSSGDSQRRLRASVFDCTSGAPLASGIRDLSVPPEG